MHTNKIKYNLYSIPYAVKMGAEVKIKDGPVILINANNSKILNFQDFDTNEEVRVHLSKNAIYPII